MPPVPNSIESFIDVKITCNVYQLVDSGIATPEARLHRCDNIIGNGIVIHVHIFNKTIFQSLGYLQLRKHILNRLQKGNIE